MAVGPGRRGHQDAHLTLTLALPTVAVEVLRQHQRQQAEQRVRAGDRWQDTRLVLTSSIGTAVDASNVRNAFRNALRKVPGIASQVTGHPATCGTPSLAHVRARYPVGGDLSHRRAQRDRGHRGRLSARAAAGDPDRRSSMDEMFGSTDVEYEPLFTVAELRVSGDA